MRNLQFDKLIPFMDQFLIGFGRTIEVTIIAFLLAFVFAIFLAVVRMTNNRVLVLIHDTWVLIIRSVPVLLQLFLMAYAFPAITGFDLGETLAGELTLAINASVYMTESIRGGFAGVDKGQREAALALAINPITTFFYITLPQAFKSILPSMMNEVILQFKSTALLAQIGVFELFMVSHNVIVASYASFEPFLFVAIIYYVVVMILTKISKVIEGRMMLSD